MTSGQNIDSITNAQMHNAYIHDGNIEKYVQIPYISYCNKIVIYHHYHYYIEFKPKVRKVQSQILHTFNSNKLATKWRCCFQKMMNHRKANNACLIAFTYCINK